MTTTPREAVPTVGLDDPWLAEPPKRSRLRLVLVGLLGAALVFYAGVQVQARYGTADAATAAAGPQAGGFTPPDGAQFPGGGGTASDSVGDPGSDASDTGSVIGTVVSLEGNKLVVEDFGGAKRTVTLGSDLRVVLEATGDRGDLKRGSTVEVSGQRGAQGQITANTITVR